jgi:SAM-dependent methyltransferase
MLHGVLQTYLKGWYRMNATISIMCPVCQHTKHAFIARPKPSLTMLKCQQCGLIFVVPRWDSQQAAEVFASFDGWPGGIVGGANNRQEAMRFIAQIIGEKMPTGGHLLDIGCANGAFFNVMRERNENWELWGTDSDPRWRGFDYGDAVVKIGSLQQANFPAHSFDVITVLDALYYMPDLLEQMSQIYCLLKPNGLFVFDIPNQRYLRIRGLLGKLLGLQRTQTFSAYPYYFSDQSLQILLSHAHFEIESRIPSQGIVHSNTLVNASMTAYFAITRQLTAIIPQFQDLVPKTIYVARALP